MKHLGKLVLGLATMTMLASCAKDITRAEARELAKGYDTAAVAYKSAEMKTTTKYTFSEKVPEIIKSTMKDSENTQSYSADEVEGLRLSEAAFLLIPEGATFKADGKALEISYKSENTSDGAKASLNSWEKHDENGYLLAETLETLMSYGEYTITIKANISVTYTK